MDMRCIPKCVNEEMNKNLMQSFTDEEILRAFNQMDPRKDPGIDGLPGIFFKKIESINEMIIFLIPKINEPTNMTNFCPISLCKVFYNIIAKTLANHLKGILPMCISQNQRALSSKNGPNKGLIVKLDMRKAYDRVEWNFLEDVMREMGF
ncbi:reverse transcriptase [Gossypium australe]|uniref:Reverse transcriptase n=1 Tax=Gossypium australe TaxID=47621 RepID=A0A5B6WVR2_9ROSI|nr:reverse transcriptase [Gossypium australe]